MTPGEIIAGPFTSVAIFTAFDDTDILISLIAFRDIDTANGDG
jgi:hypothetical protein